MTKNKNKKAVFESKCTLSCKLTLQYSLSGKLLIRAVKLQSWGITVLISTCRDLSSLPSTTKSKHMHNIHKAK